MSVPRSWLYVPGHRPDRVRKALASAADAVVIDLEDAVPAAAKDEARRSTRRPPARPARRRAAGLGAGQPADRGGGARGRRRVGRYAGRRAPPAAVREPRGRPRRRRADRCTTSTCCSRPPVACWPPGSWPARIPRSGGLASASRTSPPTSWSRPTRGWTGPGATSSPRRAPPGSGHRSRACGRASGTSTACAPHARPAWPWGSSDGRWSTRHRSRWCTRCSRPSPEEVAEARAVLATGAEARARGEVAALDAQGRFVDPAVGGAGPRRPRPHTRRP